jgi:hypothetical protein
MILQITAISIPTCSLAGSQFTPGKFTARKVLEGIKNF